MEQIRNTALIGGGMSNWIETYNKLLDRDEISTRDISRAQAIKTCNLPSRIFKFRKVNEYSLDNIRNSTVWLCSADQYNDPYECAATLDLSLLLIETAKRRFWDMVAVSGLTDVLDQDTLVQAEKSDDPMQVVARELLKGHKPSLNNGAIDQVITALSEAAVAVSTENIRRQNASLQRGMKICSFSERNDSIVMWGHYADSHRGFCVEYATSHMNDLYKNALFPVTYSNKLFDATKYVLSSMGKGDFNNLYGLIAASRKASDWSYEKEWRLILPFGESYADRNLDMPCPSAIHLGSRMLNAHKSQVVKIADSMRIPVYEMALELGEFRLSSKGMR